MIIDSDVLFSTFGDFKKYFIYYILKVRYPADSRSTSGKSLKSKKFSLTLNSAGEVTPRDITVLCAHSLNSHHIHLNPNSYLINWLVNEPGQMSVTMAPKIITD